MLRWKRRFDWGEPINMWKHPRRCVKCGCGSLYWSKTKDGWKLQHYVGGPENRKTEKFILHRCGYEPDGSPVVPERAAYYAERLAAKLAGYPEEHPTDAE